ncbi:MAG: hypothetical protein EAZ14_12440 [Runella slithyformis]|nr:MAG: hypothetical protein EAZ46_11000 [Runella sp.]TAG17068.1 MAG: hypothetical protein EAZ38_17975 [Cytophagales bacterium]TAG36212.1 MAG: hypothetical protein EAZ32_17410 [Cytophagia bacterium]TAG77790.1 MAG: hypothetical protein EAZ22_14950 [Cytophagales bacterium]TAH06621.1 MAG: hypothetical protein EAZ14_12440 [Runella slithyformis]
MKLKQLYQKSHWLSIDVVAGAVVSHRMATLLPQEQLGWLTAATLAAVVFCIYTLDRLIDNHNHAPTTARHAYYAQHKPLLIKLMGLALGFVLMALFWLPSAVLWWGGGLAVATALYLFGVFRTQSRGWFEAGKDLFVPLIYTLGVWGTAAQLQPAFTWEMATLGVVFWLIVQQNLLLQAYFESFSADSGHSLPIVWGEPTTRLVLQIIFGLALVLAVATLVATSQRYAVRAAVVLLAMTTAQHVLWQNPPRWLPNDRYRYFSEGVFLLPLLVW